MFQKNSTELHPVVSEYFDEKRRTITPATHHVSPNSAREMLERKVQKVDQAVDQSQEIQVRDFSINSSVGEMGLRIYSPQQKGPHPVIVWYHGGGWVRGSLDVSDRICVSLISELDCTIVSVDYPLAPENPFPTGLQGAFDALRWVSNHRPVLNSSQAQPLVVGGTSAGGNFAAALSLLARNEDGPDIGHQLLIVPVTDHAFNTDSYNENATGYGLERETMRWYWGKYLTHSYQGANPYASPLRSPDYSDLPPATVVTAGFDPLRDEGVAYAEKLATSGVSVTHLHYPDMPHDVLGPIFLNKGVDTSIEAFTDVVRSLTNDLSV